MISRPPSASGEPGLSYVDIEPILARLGDITEEVVLVGGQALNFWADRYAPHVPALARDAPFTSKDIDFMGSATAVRLCAERLGGLALFPEMDHPTPNVAVVQFVDDHGARRLIDFLDQPYGVKAEDVYRTALPVQFVDPALRDTGVRFKVMSPVLCMESRITNTVGLPQYQNPHGRQQARASILCAREYLCDLLDAGEQRAVLHLTERVFGYATRHRLGRTAAYLYGIEPFDAALADDRLPEKFRTTRYPHMRKTVDNLRTAQVRQHTSFGETLEARWRRSVDDELLKVRAQLARVSQRASVQVDRAREQLREHENAQPREPGPLTTLLGRRPRDEAQLAAWTTEHALLERRLEQVMKRARAGQKHLRDLALAERRAERHQPDLARRVREYRAWKLHRADDEKGRELEADRQRNLDHEIDRER